METTTTITTQSEQVEFVQDETVFLDKLRKCNNVAEKLDNAEDNAKLLAQCRAAYLYGRLNGDLEDPPRHLGSSMFLKALMVSNIPDRISELTSEEIVGYVKEAARAFRKTRLSHQPRSDAIPLVSHPVYSLDYASKYQPQPKKAGAKEPTQKQKEKEELKERQQQDKYDYAMQMSQNFHQVIEISGDGNCFYRAFLYSLIHYFHRVNEAGPSMPARQRVIKMFDSDSALWDKHWVMDVGLDLLRVSLENAPLFPMDFWHILVNRHRASDAMVFALRGIVIHQLTTSDDNKGFLWDEFKESLENIMQLGAWGDHNEAAVLAKAFGVRMTISDLTGKRRVVSDDNAMIPEETADIELIFNGYHYDMFYLQQSN